MMEKKLNKLQGQKNDGMVKLRRALKLPQNAPFKNALSNFKLAANAITVLQKAQLKTELSKYRSAAKAITVLQNKEGTHKLSYQIIRGKKIIPLSRNKNKPQERKKRQRHNTLSKLSLYSAINEHLFHQLERRVKNMYSKRKKICILQFEDINLTSYLRRAVRHKNIYHQVLVFSVQVVDPGYIQSNSDNIQPISYIFCSSTTPVLDLSAQIKLIISKLQAIGLTVLATVCKCSNLNVSTMNWLIRDTMKQYLRQGKLFGNKTFEVNGEEIIPLYNPKHLIRVLRNNLIDHNLRFQLEEGEVKIAKWEHVVALYNRDMDGFFGPISFRIFPHLTERHVVPDRISRSNVEYAMEILNSQVAAFMGGSSNGKILPEECVDTALLFLFFSNLFESLNGTFSEFRKRLRKPRLGLITATSTRKETWAESKNILKRMEFCSNGKSRVLSISNWLQNVENMEYLVEIFKKYAETVECWQKFRPIVAQPKVIEMCIRAMHSHFRS